MSYLHTHRPGFLLGCIDFCAFGLFFLFYMPLGGLKDELGEIIGRKTQRYWVAYLWGGLSPNPSPNQQTEAWNQDQVNGCSNFQSQFSLKRLYCV